jgi:monoamine oxidase
MTYDRLHTGPGRIRGGDNSNFCQDRGEWVEKNEVCINCDKYRRWDGANLDCKYHWEWEKTVDENFEAEGFDQYVGYRVHPNAPDSDNRSELDEILQKWFEDEKRHPEDKQDQQEDLELGSKFITDESEDSEKEKSKRQKIREVLEKIDNGVYSDVEGDEEEDDEDDANN